CCQLAFPGQSTMSLGTVNSIPTNCLSVVLVAPSWLTLTPAKNNCGIPLRDPLPWLNSPILCPRRIGMYHPHAVSPRLGRGFFRARRYPARNPGHSPGLTACLFFDNLTSYEPFA